MTQDKEGIKRKERLSASSKGSESQLPLAVSASFHRPLMSLIRGRAWRRAPNGDLLPKRTRLCSRVVY
jgi:hypothetical protein